MDAEKGEGRSLLTQPAEPTSWPVLQPDPKYDALRCCPWCPCLPLFTIFWYALGLLVLLLAMAIGLATSLLCCLPLACFLAWTWSWCCKPYSWRTDLYQKMIYLSYWGQNRNAPQPVANSKFMPVSAILPKGKLKKVYVDYAVNLQVPVGTQDQFLDQFLNPSARENFIEYRLPWLPQTDWYDTDTFGPDEDPVEFAMRQMAHVYPHVYQEWQDKQSDRALTRFCLYGIGAHRVENVLEDGKKMYVVRTNALAGLPVRGSFERYGGDCYFDEDWHVVKIVDQGLSTEEDAKEPVVTHPGEEGWNRAKFRFRSSLFTLVTLVDHLYGVHLQTANLFVTALREQMSADHPIRRFLTPFTYQTLSVNDNAKWNLTAPKSMGPRCFALTDKGVALAFSAAPYLLKTPDSVPRSEGGPLLNMSDYVKYIQGTGVDTEYWRQVGELLGIYETFIADYLECYYARKEDVAKDPELRAMALQYFRSLEGACPDNMRRSVPRVESVLLSSTESHYDAYNFCVKWLASMLWSVTAGHEQFGAVEVYAQDVSWTAFKWLPNQTVGTKSTATSQALLMSFTSTPMPKLIEEGTDWTHLFPKATVANKDPTVAFQTFQKNLIAMADKCDKYNETASTRAFPECFPMYTQNPRLLECSLSV